MNYVKKGQAETSKADRMEQTQRKQRSSSSHQIITGDF